MGLSEGFGIAGECGHEGPGAGAGGPVVPLPLSGEAHHRAQTMGSWVACTPGQLPVTAQHAEGPDIGRRILSVRGSGPPPPWEQLAGICDLASVTGLSPPYSPRVCSWIPWDLSFLPPSDPALMNYHFDPGSFIFVGVILSLFKKSHFSIKIHQYMYLKFLVL